MKETLKCLHNQSPLRNSNGAKLEKNDKKANKLPAYS